MTTPRDPWSDPATETEQGAPYAGPPPTAPAWVPPGHGAPPAYGAPPGYGWPAPYGAPWSLPPRGPRRPGRVVAAAVLAFVQAGLVAFASAYVYLLASVFSLAGREPGFPADAGALATEATAVAGVQIGSVVALVVAGVLALNRRSAASRWTLVAALGLQVALAAYWWVRLGALSAAAVGPDPAAVVVVGVLFFAAGPAVGLGLVCGRPAREWFAGEPAGR
ncbi:hypothetical protein ACI782_16810 [Geodermatophilus sp. SYSU D00703]